MLDPNELLRMANQQLKHYLKGNCGCSTERQHQGTIRLFIRGFTEYDKHIICRCEDCFKHQRVEQNLELTTQEVFLLRVFNDVNY